MQVIGPDEIRRINPFVTTEGVLAGAWTLDDGYVDPSSACNAMATQAKRLGATIVRHNRVLGIEQLPSGDFRVSTEQGDITCEHVVNAAGCYADRVSAWLGVADAVRQHEAPVRGDRTRQGVPRARRRDARSCATRTAPRTTARSRSRA